MRWHQLRRCLIGKERFRNREGRRDFDFLLSPHPERAGVSALIRARNEEQKIYYCLRSIIDVFDELVFVDNGSEDRTLAIVRQFKLDEDRADKLRLYSYPFRLARFGPEHDRTSEDSLKSAVYYSNWGISRCSFSYVCKWDADMVLKREIRRKFRELLKGLDSRRPECWMFPGQTVYRDLDRNFHLARGDINKEIMLFPRGFNPRFYKEKHWESLKSRPRLPVRDFPPVIFYELKFADEDEFSHWSTREWPSERKKQEWANFHEIKAGNFSGDKFERLSSSFLDAQLPSDGKRTLKKDA